MNNTCKLLGTSLVLNKGQIVELTIPSNLPKTNKIQWFAKLRGSKSDDSILIDAGDVTLRGKIVGR